MDWVYLFACISWGLTTALMLYVKLRKKTDSIPVLALVCCFLLYMNSGDLFAKRFKMYSVAVANRKVLAPQFFVSLVLAFMLASYRDLLAILVITSSVAYATIGWRAAPLLGPFWGRLKMMEIASQCAGFIVGTLLSVSMIDGSNTAELPPSFLNADSVILSLISILVVARYFDVHGAIQTIIGSAVIAVISRAYSFYIVLSGIAILSRWSPKAITCITMFLPQVAKTGISLKSFCMVVVAHALGPLLVGALLPATLDVEYVSKLAIAQEFFFSVLLGLVASDQYAWLGVVMGAWMATDSSVHLCSSISFGASGLNNGRLLARIIWQSAGSLIGSTLVNAFVHAKSIDFSHLTDVIRTTDGKRIVKQ